MFVYLITDKLKLKFFGSSVSGKFLNNNLIFFLDLFPLLFCLQQYFRPVLVCFYLLQPLVIFFQTIPINITFFLEFILNNRFLFYLSVFLSDIIKLFICYNRHIFPYSLLDQQSQTFTLIH